MHVYSKDECVLINYKGVLSMHGNKPDITSIEVWEEAYNKYCKLMRIPFFAKFKLFKTFYTWHKKLSDKKMHLAKEFLSSNLFYADPAFSWSSSNWRQEVTPPIQ